MHNQATLLQLDSLIEKSELALDLIEEQQWEDFIETQQQRQTLIENLKIHEIPAVEPVVERFKKIAALNKTLLEQSKKYQKQLEATLKNLHKSQSVNKAYQQ